MGTEQACQDSLPSLGDQGNDFTSRSLLGLFSRVYGGRVVCRTTGMVFKCLLDRDGVGLAKRNPQGSHGVYEGLGSPVELGRGAYE